MGYGFYDNRYIRLITIINTLKFIKNRRDPSKSSKNRVIWLKNLILTFKNVLY